MSRETGVHADRRLEVHAGGRCDALHLFSRTGIHDFSLHGGVLAILLAALPPGVFGQSVIKRPVAVADAVATTRLGDDQYFRGGSPEGGVARFSPSGRRFVVVVRRGNLEQNTNTFSLLLYETSGALTAPAPDLLLTMTSSSNRNAIRALKWLDDDETLAFIAENPGEVSQVYTLNIHARKLENRTGHPTAIVNYAITGDGREIVYAAQPPPQKFADIEQARREGIVVAGRSLTALMADDAVPSWENQLFLKKNAAAPVMLPVTEMVLDSGLISLSPDGRYALLGVRVRDLPAFWDDYRQALLREFVPSHRRGSFSPLTRYLLLDTMGGAITVLLEAPMLSFIPLVWGKDGHSVLLKGAYLPLDVADPLEREARTKQEYDVEVQLPGREYRKITAAEWAKAAVDKAATPLDVALVEDPNTPPQIFVAAPHAKRKVRLLDLNPQFAELNFGAVKIVEWTVDGETVTGGLYVPPDYRPGKRYPLVIQTHGFSKDRFSMDGLQEWSSGFAARPLAARGIVVLQAYGFADSDAGGRIGRDRRLGATENQAHRTFAAHAYEGAIDELDREGIIDPERVGISGFSRTVWFVAYTLTHSNHRFRAAVQTNGIDAGYFNYLAFLQTEYEEDNGGSAPFGEDGLKLWLKESPNFNLDKVRTPVRLVALGSDTVIEGWEWYAALRLQNKPVDFIEIPGAEHLLQQPWHRRIAMQGLVDWFCFWLKDEEDPAEAKAAQYTRWRELRKNQQAAQVPARE